MNITLALLFKAKSSMNIGMVTDSYYPRINGVTKSIHTFTQEYEKLGHNVYIFCPQYPEAQESEGNIFRFSSAYLIFSPEDRWVRPKRKSNQELFNKVADLNLDVVHTHTPFALCVYMALLSRKLGIPTIHSYHTFFEAYIPLYFPFMTRFLSIMLAKQTAINLCNKHDFIVTPSPPIYERLLYYGIQQPIKIAQTGTDLSPFENVNGKRMRDALGMADNAPLLLFMGRVAHEKNLPFLLEVYKRVVSKFPESKFAIAGEGPALKSVQKLVRKKKLEKNVQLLGYVSGQEWADLYAAADINMLASITETQGLVLTEAMAAGTPCVVVGELGVKNTMSQGGGLIVNLNVDEFTAAVIKLLTDKNLYLEKVEEGKKHALAWSATTKAKEMLTIYNELIATRNRSAG